MSHPACSPTSQQKMNSVLASWFWFCCGDGGGSGGGSLLIFEIVA